MGSHVFAQRLLDAGRGVELMIALDMVGYFSDEPGSQDLPSSLLRPLYPDRGDFIAVVGDLRAGTLDRQVKRGLMATHALAVHSFRAPAVLAPVHWSDHVSFRRLGLPGVQVTDTAFMRYPHYHTAGGHAREARLRAHGDGSWRRSTACSGRSCGSSGSLPADNRTAAPATTTMPDLA